MANLLKNLKRDSNLKEAFDRTNLQEISQFLNLTWEETVLVAGGLLLERRSKHNDLPSLLSDLDVVLTMERGTDVFVSLFAKGYLVVYAENFEHRRIRIAVAGNVEASLRRGCSKTLQRHFKHHNTADQDLLEMYAHAVCFVERLITQIEWERYCLQFMRKSDQLLAIKTKALKANRIEKSAIILASVLNMVSGKGIDLSWLAELFAYHELQAPRLNASWQKCDSVFWNTDVLHVEETFGRSKELSCLLTLSTSTDARHNDATETSPALPSLPNTLKRIKSDVIQEQRLIYNSTLQQSCSDLHSLLKPEQYANFARLMQEKKQPQGLAILLSGLPGTGKTELVRQLARETGRDLLLFEVSAQREMYFGESEKRVKEVFDYYKALANNPEQMPILCFNEADSIFQKRNGQHGNTAQTEIAVQTILLNELEIFNGIMICTTNLPELLDPAYTRRFLFRLQIEMPDEPTRLELLHHFFPELDFACGRDVAAEFRFSAAQLVNFNRKRSIDTIIHSSVKPLETELRAFLVNEALTDFNKPRVAVGYKV